MGAVNGLKPDGLLDIYEDVCMSSLDWEELLVSPNESEQ